MEKIDYKDYAKVWHTTTPDPTMYKFGTRKQVQYAEFLSKSGFSDEGWRYWVDRVASVDPIERRFIKYLIKYRSHTRKAIVTNSIMNTVKIEDGNTGN